MVAFEAAARIAAGRFAAVDRLTVVPKPCDSGDPVFLAAHEVRTEARIENAAPAGTLVAELSARRSYRVSPWLKSLLPADTFASCPDPQPCHSRAPRP